MTSIDCLPYLASRRWDILAVKCCEDFDGKSTECAITSTNTYVAPWVVAAVNDAGESGPEYRSAAVVPGADLGCSCNAEPHVHAGGEHEHTTECIFEGVANILDSLILAGAHDTRRC